MKRNVFKIKRRYSGISYVKVFKFKLQRKRENRHVATTTPTIAIIRV